MKRQGKIYLLGAALVALAGPFTRAEEPARPDFTKAGAVLQLSIMDHAFPGCTVAVGTDEKLLWSHGFGGLDYEGKSAVTAQTIYDLASVSKVTGVTSVYMRLVALGKVKMTDPVGKYLPEFVAASGGDAEKANRNKITIEHLLTHTAGLVGWKPFYKSVNSYADLLKAIYATPLETAPGQKFRYSDLGMILAGEIASRVGGKPLAQLERELVFDPLGMTNTMRNPPPELRPRIAPTERDADTGRIIHGVVHDENARAGQGITGHAGLFSTAQDLGKLASELLRALDGRSKLFPKAVVADFFREREWDKSGHRAVGWGLARNSDGSHGPAVSHTGFTGTSIWIDPKRRLYAVLLTNRVHPTRDNDKITKVRADFVGAVTSSFDP